MLSIHKHNFFVIVRLLDKYFHDKLYTKIITMILYILMKRDFVILLDRKYNLHEKPLI